MARRMYRQMTQHRPRVKHAISIPRPLHMSPNIPYRRHAPHIMTRQIPMYLHRNPPISQRRQMIAYRIQRRHPVTRFLRSIRHKHLRRPTLVTIQYQYVNVSLVAHSHVRIILPQHRQSLQHYRLHSTLPQHFRHPPHHAYHRRAPHQRVMRRVKQPPTHHLRHPPIPIITHQPLKQPPRHTMLHSHMRQPHRLTTGHHGRLITIPLHGAQPEEHRPQRLHPPTSPQLSTPLSLASYVAQQPPPHAAPPHATPPQSHLARPSP